MKEVTDESSHRWLGDVLVYECSFAGQDRETEEVFSFDYVAETVDEKIRKILEATNASSYQLYLTSNDRSNFRFDIATVKPYKGTRSQPKPFHYYNTRAYLESLGAIVVSGMEADDMLAIEATKDLDNTVIVTRDKDLRQVPCWHYGWEMGLQPEFFMQKVDEIGQIELEKNKIKGTGLKFFYSQLITGDTVDNIPGLPRGGPSLAYKLLANTNTEGEMFEAVREAYRGKYEDEWEERLLEQAYLLYMIREKEGDFIKMWNMPNEEEVWLNVNTREIKRSS